MNDLDKYQLRGAMTPLIAKAFEYYGLKEVPGKGSNPVIMQMAERLGVKKIYTDDDMSWCALFISNILVELNYPMPFKQYEILRAGSYLKWGNPVEIGGIKRGDIVVLKRPGGHHVFIAIAESKNTVFGIGGNQGNTVKISEFDKDRIAGVRRWYPGNYLPPEAKTYYVSEGGIISTNEA